MTVKREFSEKELTSAFECNFHVDGHRGDYLTSSYIYDALCNVADKMDRLHPAKRRVGVMLRQLGLTPATRFVDNKNTRVWYPVKKTFSDVQAITELSDLKVGDLVAVVDCRDHDVRWVREVQMTGESRVVVDDCLFDIASGKCVAPAYAIFLMKPTPTEISDYLRSEYRDEARELLAAASIEQLQIVCSMLSGGSSQIPLPKGSGLSLDR